MHTDTVAAEFTCTHCNAVPEQVVDGKATIAIVRHKLGCPTLDGPDPHTLARPSMTNASIRRTGQPVSWSHNEHSSLSTRGARRGWWSRGHHHRAGLDGQGAAAMNTTASALLGPNIYLAVGFEIGVLLVQRIRFEPSPE